eukprot:TRINITY_DN1567_c0_g1_i1.p1 TRINITY_DN1567_c0_g1~~TRINITY_DN1567_c0_g1_i1.p1  ORF type:complete len:186 (-),score=31.27 TRINITY_DN1567_c0_g1_i1:353-910(-)
MCIRDRYQRRVRGFQLLKRTRNMIPSTKTPGYVCCPYNREHDMPKDKLHWHFTRCQAKKQREHEFAKCKYNALHIVLKSEHVAHELKCPDKSNVGNSEEDEDLLKAMSMYVQSNHSIARVQTKPIEQIKTEKGESWVVTDTNKRAYEYMETKPTSRSYSTPNRPSKQQQRNLKKESEKEGSQTRK